MRQKVVFELNDAGAKSVALAGDMNSWDPAGIRMQRSKRGPWRVVIQLQPGTYQYRFVVDGQWIPDPANPAVVDNGLGGHNSVRVVEA